MVFENSRTKCSKFKFIPFELPKIKNVETTFTDAILIEDKIYFLAAAEDTASTYDFEADVDNTTFIFFSFV